MVCCASRRVKGVLHVGELHTERMIQRGRVVALVVASGLLVSFGSDRSVRMTIAVVLLVATVAATEVVLRTLRDRRWLRAVGLFSFFGDAAVCGIALSAVADDPIDPISVITIIIAVEAALRWGSRGALLGGGLAGVMAVVWAASGYEAIGRDLPATSIVFRWASNIVIALPVGLLIQQLRTQRKHTHRLFEHANDAIVVLDRHQIIDANPAAADLAGLPIVQLLGRSVEDVLVPLSAVDGTAPVPVTDPAGRQRWLAVDSVVDEHETRILLVRDITADTQRTHELRRQALHDPLTGLANRAALRARLADRLPHGDPLGLVFLDLDDFKAINDRYGHTCGDELLTGVAQRLRGVTRDGDVAYRWAGDEFCIVADPATQQVLATIAARIAEVLAQPFRIRGELLTVSASVGTAMAGPDDDEASLVHRADAMMYRTKKTGRDRPSADTSFCRLTHSSSDLETCPDANHQGAGHHPELGQ